MNNPGRQHQLVEVLRSRDNDLADRAIKLIGEAHRIIEFTKSTFSSGTDHTAKHTTTVEQIGRMLLPDDFLAALTNQELFFLALACHYHDLAMAGTEADDQSPQTRDQIRRDHAIRVGEIVRGKWTELGFEDERTAFILGEICRGHRPRKIDGEASWEELSQVEILGPGISVRVRLVSSLIYAIDELHLGADRAPERIQRWREIHEEESRRHWRRHKAVNGPALIAGKLLFQVDADTPGFEQYLRTQVFRKAFTAVREMSRQAGSDGVVASINGLAIEWKRNESLSALLALVASDLVSRTRDELEQALFGRIQSELSEKDALDGLCIEVGNSESSTRSAAGRSVGDAITSRHLIFSPGHLDKYELATEEAISSRLFARMRSADELDQLFLGRYRAHWEEQLFDSSYGRAYVTKIVLPQVGRSYCVNLTARKPEDPLRAILELSPSASRLVLEFRPPTSNLVKSDLLGRTALVGAFFDLYADPDRLLDGLLRSAIRSLIGSDTVAIKQLRLFEELALVGGLSTQQVHEAQSASDAAIQELEAHGEAKAGHIEVHLTQTLPLDVPQAATHLPRLLLASRRANISIQLANAPDHRLTVEMTPQAALGGLNIDSFMLEVGPVEVVPTVPARLPARVELSRETRTIRLYFNRFDSIGPSKLPVIASLPMLPPEARTNIANFGLSLHWPSLTIRDLRTFDSANQILRNGRAQIEFVIEDQGALLASISVETKEKQLFSISPLFDAIKSLRGLDGSLPAPLFVSKEELSRISSLNESERGVAWHALREKPAEERPLVTSLFLRFIDEAGHSLDERFLRFLPGFGFQAPVVKEGGVMDQGEINRQWHNGEGEFMITAFFEVDIPEATKSLLEWCRSTTEDFPFQFGAGDVTSPLTRSRIAIRFLPPIDRTWHRERPIVFEFRRVSRRESYQLEATYWRSVNDLRRAELADEIGLRPAEGLGDAAELNFTTQPVTVEADKGKDINPDRPIQVETERPSVG